VRIGDADDIGNAGRGPHSKDIEVLPRLNEKFVDRAGDPLQGRHGWGRWRDEVLQAERWS